jgi:hypothetical protein
MLSIITLAGFELQLFNVAKIPENRVFSNGQEIINKSQIKEEISSGIKELLAKNPDSMEYYKQLYDYLMVL